MWARASPIPKGYFFTGINEMTNRISPPCPRWLMGASVSRSVSPRQELTDKVAARWTYPLRAVLRTVKKTGGLEPTHQKPEGELVVIWSVCLRVSQCVRTFSWAVVSISILPRFASAAHWYNIHHQGPVATFLKGVNSTEWPAFLCDFTLWYCKSLQFSDESRITWTHSVLEKLTAGGS